MSTLFGVSPRMAHPTILPPSYIPALSHCGDICTLRGQLLHRNSCNLEPANENRPSWCVLAEKCGTMSLCVHGLLSQRPIEGLGTMAIWRHHVYSTISSKSHINPDSQFGSQDPGIRHPTPKSLRWGGPQHKPRPFIQVQLRCTLYLPNYPITVHHPNGLFWRRPYWISSRTHLALLS